MRVVAGRAGGLRLECPATGLRPTMDRVKAAIFSSLGERVPGARVLDLFAGTGGLGIEALSRGAAHATFVEESRRHAECLRRNLDHTGLAGEIVRNDVFRFLTRRPPAAFDLILADPPYGEPGDDPGKRLLALEILPEWLAPDGLLLLERRSGSPPAPSPLAHVRTRRYGSTEVACYARP